MHPLPDARTRRQSPDISVIVPVYQNADTLRELYERLSHVLIGLQLSYEFLFVDDACPKGSSIVLRELAREDVHVAVLELKRNVGQQHAILTGLKYSVGERLVVMDADLQDPPEAIPELLAKMREGYAAVFAGRRGPYEPPLRLFTSRMFKELLHLLCGVPADAGPFVVMTRDLSERVLATANPNPHLVTLIGCTRLPVISIPVARAQRPSGSSGHSSWARFRLALSAVEFALLCKLWPNREILQHRIQDAPIANRIGARFEIRYKRGE